jgi:DNA polymerase
MAAMRTVRIEPTFESWQAAARRLLRAQVPPDQLAWQESASAPEAVAALAKAAALPEAAAGSSAVRVPRQFLERARSAAVSRDPRRWAVLYETLWRILHERRDLLADDRDPLVRRLNALAETPTRSRAASPPRPTTARPAALPLEGAGAGAAPFVPPGAGLAELKRAAARCTGCDLYRHASQVVFGAGPPTAYVVLVGEQPGDQEDRKGAPFVGPAGEVLDRALVEVGLDRERVYVSNVVKHFKFVERGKRRIHQTPQRGEIAACRPWLEAELEVIKPQVLVALGATAARALFGPEFRLLREHGQFRSTPWAARTLATLHPSAVLRGQDETEQARLYDMLVTDLRLVAAAAA